MNKSLLQATLWIFLFECGCQGVSGTVTDDRKIQEVLKTCRIPATEKALRILSKSYIQPDRLGLGTLRESAADRIQNIIPELTTRTSKDSADIIVSSAEASLRVRCPTDAPLWSFKMCARRLACAIRELVPDLSNTSTDHILAGSLLSNLDPHTKFIWGRGDACFFTKEGCKKKDAHVGIRVGRSATGLRIVSVAANSPAASAGIRRGDRLLRINGLPASDIEPEGAEWLLYGYEGSKVVVLIDRPGDKRYRVWLSRKYLGVQKQFEGKQLGRIAYLRIREFAMGVSEDVKEWLAKLKNQKGYILDLRDNPGGLMLEAIKIADLFIDRGLIMFVKTSEGRQRFELPASSSGTVELKPLVVLVNSQSASASEMLAGTLQGNERGLVIGQRTFGKGSVQVPVEIPGGFLLMTTHRYFTGKNLDIQNAGIVPDISLRPVKLGQESVRLRHWGKPFRESDYDLALAGRTSRTAKTAKVTIDYLGTSRIDSSDNTVGLAKKLIRKMPWIGKSKGRQADIVRAASGLQREEEGKILTALGRMGVAVGVGEKGEASFEVRCGDLNVVAGLKAVMKVSVTNTGSGQISGLSCRFETANPFLADREMLFGSIAPGSSQERKLSVNIPVGAFARREPINLVWYGASGKLLGREPSGPYFLEVASRTKPRVALHARLEDNPPVGNGDGRVSPGEKVKVCARIKNFGKRKSLEGFVSVDTRFGPVSDWDQLYKRFQPIEPGGVREFCFGGTIRKDFKRGTDRFVLRFGEWQGRILGSRSLLAVSAAETSKASLLEREKRHIWNPSAKIWADKLVVESEPACIGIQAWSNGEDLRDVAFYLNDKKVSYDRISGSNTSLRKCFEVDKGTSRVDVLVRKDSHAYTIESIFVHRM